MKKSTIINKIIKYYEDNDDAFIECIEALDNCNGCLGNARCFSIAYEFDEQMYGRSPLVIAELVCTGQFNPCDEYFYFDCCGLLCSTDYREYDEFLSEELILKMLIHRCEIDLINDDEELNALFNELEKACEEAKSD